MWDHPGPGAIARGPRYESLLACCLLTLLCAAPPLTRAANNVVEYTYDAVGNITNIKRQVNATFAVTGFSPGSGAVGAAVVVYGTGFSAIPASNTVKFNGTPATVDASDAGSISVTVPAGATNGRITVAVGGVTATSPQDFYVITPGAPTITAYSPGSGTATTSVAVTGTGFEVGAGATTVRLNATTATATFSSTTAFNLTVPANTASGRITATTSAGTGASIADFLVPPPGVALADVVSTVRVSPGGPAANVAVSASAKHALILFDAVPNTYYTLQFGQIALSPSSATPAYKLVKPDNTVLTSGYIGVANPYRPTIHLPALPAAGTYTVVVSPGSATLNSNVRVVADPVIAIDGAAAATSVDTASQSSRFVVAAASNQRIGLGALGLTTTPTNASATLRLFRPDGIFLTSASCTGITSTNPEGNCALELEATSAGAYTVVAEPTFGYVTNLSLQASSEMAGGTLTADTAADLNLTRVGQVARYTFAGSAGVTYGVDLSGVAMQPGPQYLYFEVRRPDNGYVTSCSAIPPAPNYCELSALATSGNYTVKVWGYYGAYGVGKLTLKQGSVIAPGDAPLAFTAQSAGETLRYRFDGTTGQAISVAVSELAYIGSSTGASNIAVYRPDGGSVSPGATCNPSAYGGDCYTTFAALPSTGRYSVVIKPPPQGIRMTGKVNVSSELTGALPAGTAQAVSAARPGQNARYTFSGAAGDSIAVKLFGLSTTPSGNYVYVYLVRPDASKITLGSVMAGGASMLHNIGSLPAAGTYAVLVEPVGGVPWQAQLMVDAGPLLAVDGTMGTTATSAAGEQLRYRFAGTAGQKVVVGLRGLTYGAASSSATNLQVFRPDSTTAVASAVCTTAIGGCEADMGSLAVSGTYNIVLQTPAAISITAGTLAVNSAPLPGTLVIGDPAQTIAITRPGQVASYSFGGTSGQLLRLSWTSTTVSAGANVAVKVLKPDGTQLQSAVLFNATPGSTDLPSLPATGSYTVLFDPSSAASMSASVSLSTR